jgi:hypothetical protein
MNLIRKISVGSNYPDKVLHYQVDKPVRMGAEEKNVKRIEESFEEGSKVYKIFVEGEMNSALLWKKIINVPVVVEYLIGFD